MSEEHLLEHVADKVATITLNRPDALNAVTRDMLKGLYEKVERLSEDPSVGAIVLTGAGRAFCSGGDVKNMAALPGHGHEKPSAAPVTIDACDGVVGDGPGLW